MTKKNSLKSEWGEFLHQKLISHKRKKYINIIKVQSYKSISRLEVLPIKKKKLYPNCFHILHKPWEDISNALYNVPKLLFQGLND